ncbi:nuclear transport factor 2 family protein [Halieaceae bacterium IMCC14734]|uniref:Nuclear transport factor 2 family protein n=1 Tax=Candidatus Litorirhabdus singularis TaxID=2518993 RepID=A0ABT3TIV4_9GAMM|nr:hypothetical protein [Candidatus Litorirhabdus singularis]MCX2982243.1 nuclear transport factor 2 family protein [Candidatus Litorirhabdus singularis]
MSDYIIDPRRNWVLMESRMAVEPDPQIRAHMQIVINHARYEAAADFEQLMATVSPQASYHSYSGDPAADAANSPQGKAGVADYYRMIVESGLHRIEHKSDRIIADRDHIMEEGVIKMAYPGAVLQMMGHADADAEKLYLYQSRLVIIWGFDNDGLVQFEDSYAPPGGFEGILQREITPDQIHDYHLAEK